MQIRRLLEESDTRGGMVVDIIIQSLIIVSLITFTMETLPDLTPKHRELLYVIEVVTVLIFSVEYIARICVAENRLRFVTSFFGIFDLLAILPFYFSLGIDLRAARAFRLLRLFRIFKLARYSRAMQRLHVAFQIAKEELILFSCAAAIVLFLSATGIYYFENKAQPDVFSSIFHSFWWAICTLTTVGYGDVYPVTPGGRFFTLVVLVVGLGIVSVPAGLVSSSLSKARQMEDQS